MKAAGAMIRDIGPDFPRRSKGIISKAYETERMMTKYYDNYLKVYIRDLRGVPGFDLGGHGG